MGIFLFFGFFYLLTGNQNFIFDALANAIACEAQEPFRWFHPNHILYPFIGMLWYRLERLVGYTGFAVYSLERFNSLLTVCGLVLLYLTSTKFVSFKKAWILPFFMGSSYAIWHFAVDGYTVGASTFFICLLIWQLSRLIDGNISHKDIVVTSILSFLYIGVHALGVLHALAIAWWFSTFNLNSSNNSQLKFFNNKGVLYLCYLALFLASIYLFIYFSIIKSDYSNGFISWVVGYASYYGLENALQWPAINFEFLDVLKGHWKGWLHALIYPFRATPTESLVSAGIGLTTAATIIWASLKKKGINKRNDRFTKMLIAWGALNAFLIGFWVPGYPGFRIHFFFPLFLAAFIVLSKNVLYIRSFFLMACVVFTFNFTGPIYYDSFITNNSGFQLLQEINQKLKKGDLFLCAEGDVPDIAGLRTYFFPHIQGGSLESRLFEFRETSLDPLKKSLIQKMSEGKNIFITGSLQKKNIQLNIEKQFGVNPEQIDSLIIELKLTYAFELSNKTKVFKASL